MYLFTLRRVVAPNGHDVLHFPDLFTEFCQKPLVGRGILENCILPGSEQHDVLLECSD